MFKVNKNTRTIYIHTSSVSATTIPSPKYSTKRFESSIPSSGDSKALTCSVSSLMSGAHEKVIHT